MGEWKETREEGGGREREEARGEGGGKGRGRRQGEREEARGEGGGRGRGRRQGEREEAWGERGDGGDRGQIHSETANSIPIILMSVSQCCSIVRVDALV